MISPVACLLVILPVLIHSAPDIQFPFGLVQGYDKLAFKSQKPYLAYYGIPFANPPVAELRFQPPQPFVGAGSDKIVSSSTFRPGCIQPVLSNSTQILSEDCLYLNVFVPAGSTSDIKVMFWVHGGAFQVGDASMYVPSQLVADYDVIVVTTQYRLGVLGFLTSGSGDGNNGLRDQILALKWVKDNIQNFGGDPNDITIFGESAGSASVSLLSISPLTKGLFTKVIMQSGSATSNWAINRNPSDLFNQASERLGCTSSLFNLSWFRRIRNQDKMNCLRTKSLENIQSLDTPLIVSDKYGARFRRGDSRGRGNSQQQTNLSPSFSAFDPANTFVPVVDGQVIPKNPELLMGNKTYLDEVGALDRSYIVGVNNNEGGLALSILPNLESVKNMTIPDAAEGFIRNVANAMLPSSSLDSDKLDLLLYEYTYPRQSDGTAPLQGVLDFIADSQFVAPSVQFSRALIKASNRTSVYMYLFNHFPQLLQANSLIRGSTHGLDMSYEFDEDRVPKPQAIYANAPLANETSLTNLFRAALTNFAKTGNPSSSSAQVWPRYDPRDEQFLSISLEPEVSQHLYAKRVALWTDFIFKKQNRRSDWRGRWWC